MCVKQAWIGVGDCSPSVFLAACGEAIRQSRYVCVCVCVCVDVYIYIYIYIHTRIYTYRYIHILCHIHVHIYISTHIWYVCWFMHLCIKPCALWTGRASALPSSRRAARAWQFSCLAASGKTAPRTCNCDWNGFICTGPDPGQGQLLPCSCSHVISRSRFSERSRHGSQRVFSNMVGQCTWLTRPWLIMIAIHNDSYS